MSKYRTLVSKLLTEANSFWADSGVIEASYAPMYNFQHGHPITAECYHMTPHSFTKFKIGQVNAWGEGVYLTNKPEDCSFNPEVIKDWNKMRLWVSLFKPFVYEDVASEGFINWLWGEIQNVVDESTLRNSELAKYKEDFDDSYMSMYYRVLFKNMANTQHRKESTLALINKIKFIDETYHLNVCPKLGIDGMILPFGKTDMIDSGNKDTVWYVCYKPNQIKSYDNGNPNLDSDDINESTEKVLLDESSTQTNLNSNFWKWFGDSKTVDENGNPLIFYHGTRQNFNTFKSKYSDKLLFFAYDKKFAEEWASHAPLSQDQESVKDNIRAKVSKYLTKKFTDKYGLDWYKDSEIFEKFEGTAKELREYLLKKEKIQSKVIPVYIKATKIFNPKENYKDVLDEIIKYYNKHYDFDVEYHLERIKEGAWVYFEHKPVIDKIWSLGYDAIELSESNAERTTLAIREGTNQVKSIYNKGSWDSSNNIFESIEEVLTERLFPEIPDEQYKDLLKDTSLNGKANAYTKFFGNYLVSNNLHKDEDIAGLTKRHRQLYKYGCLKPICDYKDIFELIHELDRLNGYQTNSEKDKLAKASAKVIGEVDGYKLYEITSYAASQKYGAGTTWCTASKSTKSYYNRHRTMQNRAGKQKLIYAINEDDKKFALNIWIGKDQYILYIFSSDDKVVAGYHLAYDIDWDKEKDGWKLKPAHDYLDLKPQNPWDKEIVADLTQWAIDKYDLTKSHLKSVMEKEYMTKFVESAEDKFYQYSNTDSNAIGICGLNREAARGDSYTMIIDMSPDEFIGLAAEKFDEIGINWFEEQIKQGVPMAMPFLEIEIEDAERKIARVYGHEGRHRSLAVSNLGYTNAQVILYIRDFVRAGYKKEDLIGWTIMGQKSHAGNKNTHENNSFVIK